MKNILFEYNSGEFYEPENKNSFIEGLLNFYDNRAYLKKYVPGLIKMSKDFDRRKQANKMLRFLKKIYSDH